MANQNQAPKLRFDIAKPSSGAKDVDYVIPGDIFGFISTKLVKAKAPAQLSLMIYLMGNKPGWGCSTEHILAHTGIGSKQTLSNVKRALKERGWIDYAEGEFIEVKFQAIREQMGHSENDPNLKGHSENIEGSFSELSKGHSENIEGSFSDLKKGHSQNDHNKYGIDNKINKKQIGTGSETGGSGEMDPSPLWGSGSPTPPPTALRNQEEEEVGRVTMDILSRLDKSKVEWIDKETVRLSNIPKPGRYKVVKVL